MAARLHLAASMRISEILPILSVLQLLRLAVATGVVYATGTLAGCSSDASTGLTEAGGCRAPLDQVRASIPVSMCPETFDAPGPIGCQATAELAGSCGSYDVRAGGCGFDRLLCVYDSLSGAIVGAARSTDTNAYCGMRSSCLFGGDLPNEVACIIDRLDFSACQLSPPS